MSGRSYIRKLVLLGLTQALSACLGMLVFLCLGRFAVPLFYFPRTDKRYVLKPCQTCGIV